MPRKFDIPLTGSVPLIRADYTNGLRWTAALNAARATYEVGPTELDSFSAYFVVLDDARYAGIKVEDVVASLPTTHGDTFDSRIDSIDTLPDSAPSGAIIADDRTLSSDEFPFIVIDLLENPGYSVRVPANRLWVATNSMDTMSMFFWEWSEEFEKEESHLLFPYEQ